MNKADKDKVIAALEYGMRTCGEDQAAFDALEDALTIMRGLAEDAEPVGEVLHRMKYHSEDPSDDLDWELFPMDCTECETCIDVLIVRASPQAAQTAVKSESLAQAAQAPARLPSEGKPIEALAPTEAALREVVRLSEDAGLYDDFQTEAQERPAYPEGDVVGLCVCGSWSGGRCLRCEWRAGSKP